MDTYPTLDTNGSNVVEVVRQIVASRADDVSDFQNLNSTFISGRRSKRIPSSSTDVNKNDAVNDVITDPSGGYEYKLININGSLQWRRSELRAF